MNKSLPVTILLALLLTQATPAARGESGCDQILKEATAQFARGKIIDASQTLEKGQKSCSQSSKYQLLLSTVLSRRHGFQVQAAEAARRATELDPQSRAAYLQLGVCLMALKDQEGAAGAFENLVKVDPTSYEAWSSLGQLYLAQGKGEEAKLCAKKAACLEPESRAAKLNSIKSLAKIGKFDQARGALKQLLDSDSLEPEFFILVAETAKDCGAYEEAIQAGDRVLQTYPQSQQALEAKAVSQLWLRQYKGCLETAASMKEPQEIQALAYLKLGNLKEARAAHQAIAKGSEESRLAQLGGGLIKLRDGNLSEALKKIEGSLAEDQLFAPSHMELARIYLALGDFKKAEEEASEVERLPSAKASALALLGRAIILKGQGLENLSLASKKLNEAHKLDEKNPDALIGLGLLKLKSGNVDQAKDYARQCLKVEPGNIDGLMLSARINFARGDKKAAARDLKNARAQAPGSGTVLVTMAEQLLSEGKADKAIKLLQSKVDSAGDYPPLEFTLAKILNEKGDKASAAVHFKNSLNKGLAGKNASEAKKAIKEIVN